MLIPLTLSVPSFHRFYYYLGALVCVCVSTLLWLSVIVEMVAIASFC